MNINIVLSTVKRNDITSIKRAGRIATLNHDLFDPHWHYKPRRPSESLASWPHTSIINHVPRDGKGSMLPLTQAMKNWIVNNHANGTRLLERIMIPSAGWINADGVTNKTQRLTWSCNHVIVLETRGEYSRIYAPDYRLPHVGNFFTQDGRLIYHKFNAIKFDGTLLKLGGGFDCYTPLISDGEMWKRTDSLEMWPELPYTLDTGQVITEYILRGFDIYGIAEDGANVLLRHNGGFTTSWKIMNPEVPI